MLLFPVLSLSPIGHHGHRALHIDDTDSDIIVGKSRIYKCIGRLIVGRPNIIYYILPPRFRHQRRMSMPSNREFRSEVEPTYTGMTDVHKEECEVVVR